MVWAFKEPQDLVRKNKNLAKKMGTIFVRSRKQEFKLIKATSTVRPLIGNGFQVLEQM